MSRGSLSRPVVLLVAVTAASGLAVTRSPQPRAGALPALTVTRDPYCATPWNS